MSTTETPTTEADRPSADDAPGADRRWLILVIACLAQFMVVLDVTIVNIALPSVQRGLHFSASNLQWVINAYTLIFGGFLLLGGRAADLIGRRRLFVVGIILFTAASALNGFAQSSAMLIIGRGLQGLGGALVSPAALAVVTTTFPSGPERTRALAIWSAIAAGGSAVGLVLGGILVDIASWRWVFFVNVPVGVIAVMLALRFVPESRGNVARRTFDAGGALTGTGGLIVLVYGIVKAQSYGWGSARSLITFAIAVILLVSFVFIERRSAGPLLRLGIFRVRALAVGDGALLLVSSALFGMFFFASLYVQEILGYSPLKAGLAFLPVTGGIIIGSGISQAVIPKLGVRVPAIFGTTIAALGLLVLTQLPVHGHYVSDLLSGLLPLAFGLGLVFVPVTLMATSGVPGDDAGLASGLFNVAQQVGGSLGLAILSTLAASQTSSLLHHGTRTGALAARVSGYHVAFLVAACMMFGGAAMLSFLLRRSHLREVEAELQEGTSAAVAA